jgi:A/G-specific adenine glycosylase
MLQQTTVAAVVPYFERFVARFPTLADLAAADEQDILREWQGLGYYRRARHLHLAAKRVIADHDGQLRDDPAMWSSLPGVGRYILGAVLSQAFDRRVPIVEANSQRVLCRLYGKEGDASREPTKSWLWRTAEELMPRQRAGDFNQAMMELGALICTPDKPRCDECPVAGSCRARQLGKQNTIPQKPIRRATVNEKVVAVAVQKRGRTLLAQRSMDAKRWANMWELPQDAVHVGESSRRTAARLLDSIGLQGDIGDHLATVKHGVTHHRITLVGIEVSWRHGRFRSSAYAKAKWVAPNHFWQYPTGTAQRKLLEAAAQTVNIGTRSG